MGFRSRLATIAHGCSLLAVAVREPAPLKFGRGLDNLAEHSVELDARGLLSVVGVLRVASRSSQSFNRNPPADEVRMNRPEYTAGRCGGTSNI